MNKLALWQIRGICRGILQLFSQMGFMEFGNSKSQDYQPWHEEDKLCHSSVQPSDIPGLKSFSSHDWSLKVKAEVACQTKAPNPPRPSHSLKRHYVTYTVVTSCVKSFCPTYVQFSVKSLCEGWAAICFVYLALTGF